MQSGQVIRRDLVISGAGAGQREVFKQMRIAPINTVLVLAGGLGWLFTLQPEPGPLVPVHYGLLIAAIVGAVRACADKWHAYRNCIKVAGTVAGVCLVILCGHYDYYESRWTNEHGTKYVDTYHRFSRDLVYRWLFLASGGSSHGPMAGEGKPKPHGMWTHMGNGGIDYTFYWYGEEVSEGEWHLRNR